MDQFKTMCKQFRSPIPIVLLGERNLVKKLPYACIYSYCELLKQNNTVIDLTEDSSLSIDPNFDQFCRDISIINSAKAVISLGYGGNFVMNLCFGKNILAYVGDIVYDFNQFKNHTGFNFYRNWDEFSTKLQSILL